MESSGPEILGLQRAEITRFGEPWSGGGITTSETREPDGGPIPHSRKAQQTPSRYFAAPDTDARFTCSWRVTPGGSKNWDVPDGILSRPDGILHGIAELSQDVVRH
jgi:hypothetical protein